MKSHCKLLSILSVIAYSFVGPGSVEAQPTLIAYTPNPTYNRRPQLHWYNSNISTYRIQLDTNSLFTSPIVSTTTTDTTYAPISDLPLGTIYWRVGSEADTSVWSAVFSVTIADSTPMSGGRYIAIGDSGTVLTSPDGVTWTIRASEIKNRLFCVTSNDSQLVAVGNNGVILTSPDGIFWTSRTSGIAKNLLSVTYGNGLFVAVGDTNKILTSPDGIVWTIRSGTYSPYSGLNSVTYGNGQFVAVAKTIYSFGTNPDPPYGLLVSSATYNIISTDGITWGGIHTLLYQIGSDMTVLNGEGCVTYGNGQFVVAFSGSGSKVCTSGDGINWTTHSILIYSVSVTYGNGQYVAVQRSIDYSMTSPDGITWTYHALSIPACYADSSASIITWGNGQYVVVGCNGTILTSPDGATWTIRNAGTTNVLHSVIWMNAYGSAIKPFFTTAALNTVLEVQARNSLLMISLPSAMLGKSVDLAVYNASGREVVRKKVQRGIERFAVPVPNLAVGAYILSVKDGIQKRAIRFVVVR